MSAATTQAQIGTGATVTWASAEGGMKYSREDSIAGTTPVPIPTATGTNFSWIKNLVLAVITAGTTTISNRRVSRVTQDEKQTITITGGPTGGTFTVTFGGYTTSAIAYNASAATVQSALQALTSIGTGNATVTGSAGGPYTVDFNGTLADTAQALLTASGSALTGGTSPGVAIARVQSGWQTSGLAMYWQAVAVASYAQASSGNMPAASGSNGATPSGYTAITTSASVYDSTGVSSASTGTNGEMCVCVLGVDDTYTAGANSATTIASLIITYDEA